MQVLIGVVIGFVLGWVVREAVALHKINAIVKAMQEPEPVVKANELRVKIEKHNDIFYLYADSDDRFIAQGATKEEVTEILKKRFSTITIVADPDNVKEVGFK